MVPAQYFHGGVPGLSVGDLLRSADELGLKFEYNKRWYLNNARYDTSKVYLTCHRGTAMGYAARYLDKFGRPRPGWVYLVEPTDTPRPDPDYGTFVEGLAMYCKAARIIGIEERDVSLSSREQNRLAWPHLYWDVGMPLYEEDGTLIPSAQMTESGVTQDYIDLLPKWIDVSEIDGHGQMTIDGHPVPIDVTLGRFSHLQLVARDHIIKIADKRSVPNVIRCSCSAEFTDKYEAASHKVDVDKLQLIAERNIPPEVPHDPFKLVIVTIARSARGQWSWFWNHKQ